MTDRHPRILCVDDEPKVLEGLTLHLHRYYEVHTVTSGAAALELFEHAGPFVVVLSDMRMPGMDGATLLSRVRRQYPDTVRMLLTGHADMDSAIAAVNEGQLFRFLTKPCPPPILRRAFEAAIAQYRLLTAERVLLEQTLRGVIQTLTDVLSLTNPVAFGRANRLKRYALAIAQHIGLQQNLWQLEVAAMLSQISCIILPAETLDKLYRGWILNENERAMVKRLPSVTDRLLGGIPRLESVLAILKAQEKTYRFDEALLEDIVPVGGHILKIVGDFDILISQGSPVNLALDTLRGRTGIYDVTLLGALITAYSHGAHAQQVKEISILGLEEGMVLAEDIRIKSGAVLITSGHEVTPSFLERIYNFQEQLLSLKVKVFLSLFPTVAERYDRDDADDTHDTDDLA